MKNLLKVLILGLVVLTSCEKDEVVEPMIINEVIPVYTIYDLSGKWTKSGGNWDVDEVEIIQNGTNIEILYSGNSAYIPINWRIDGMDIKNSSAGYSGSIINPREIRLKNIPYAGPGSFLTLVR